MLVSMEPQNLTGERFTLRLRREALPYPNPFAAASATGLTHSSLTRTLNGETAPSATMVGTLLRVTGLPFDALFEVVPDPGRSTRKAA